jgi:PAS domain S-box-containing protein
MRVTKLRPRGSPHVGTRTGVLARMRVGTKLLLLVLLPTCGFFAFAAIAAIDHWRSAERLRDFRDATRLSFASAGVAEALADERRAVTFNLLGEPPVDGLPIAEQERAVDAALRRATPRTPRTHAPIDVAGRLRTTRAQLDALRRKAATGSLVLQEIVEEYGVIVRGVSGIVRDLDSGRPSRATGRAADAYVALVQAVEAAEMERVTQAAALVRGTEGVRVRGVIVEANALDTFREYAARPLVARLDTLLSQPSSATVERVREGMVRDPASVQKRVSLAQWQAASGTRIDGLRRLERETARDLDATASTGLDAAWASARRVVAASLGLLILMTGVGLVLRRSITRPLEEVSEAARMLSAGQLASGVSYAGADEIGEVAAAFRGLHGTAEHLAEEIRAMNVAVGDDRLDHRADVAAFDGSWAELMAGMNDTMAAFAELQTRREQAERHADRIFDMSLDMLCIAGFDGYFKRVNPAFARLLGYPMETMLSRPTREFVHPDDRRARDARHGARDKRHDVRYEQRQLCSDGSVRWVEWSARFVPEERRIYGVGRDVTESRRAAAEQAALRRVATLVAKGAAPAEIFAAVAREVQALFEAASAGVVRFESGGSIAVMGSVPDGSGATHENVAAAVADAAGATRIDGAVGAPVVVEDRLWGVVAASEGAEPLPRGTEERLARFTDLVATAIANAESRAEVAASRARVIATGDEERRRLVRDLHDGGQQGLVHTVIALELASRAYEEGDEGAPALVAEALEHARRANDELRELSHGILPSSLRRGGLREATETLVSRVPLPVAIDLSVGRLPPVVEATAYFVLAEALTNVVKHAHAASAEVSVDVVDGAVRILVRDDGVGGAQADGRGLTGLRDRLESLHGRLAIDSPTGRGTVLAAEIPLSGQQVEDAAAAESAASSEL